MPKLPYTSEHEYDGYIKVNSCGKQWLADRDYKTVNPEGRIDFSIRYVLKGLGHCEIYGKTEPVNEGCLMLHCPKAAQNYSFKKENQSVILWVHFSGTACELLKKSVSKTTAVIKIQDRKQFESAFERMIAAHYKKNDFSDSLSSGYIIALISLVAQSNTIAENSSNFKNENLERILSLMHNNFDQHIDIKEYAKICCVSEDHFIRLFKAYTGLPPYNYQLKLRIDRAIEMLENTQITVSNCAETVGFQNAAYFSKVFKRFTGHSPSYYKK